MNQEVDDAFKNRKPYTFLQYAYFQLGKTAKAVQACYTYSTYDPDDDAMKDNLDYYKNREDYSESMLIDLEEKPLMIAYKKGVEAYQDGDYLQASELLKLSVEEFYKEEGLCRTRCDRSFDFGRDYQFDTKRQHEHQNDHFRQILECNLLCPTDAASISKKLALINFLPELYNYLQFASYQLGNLKEANKYAQSYLLFLPGDESMKSNLGFYTVKEEVQPHGDATHLKKRIDLQLAMLKFYYQTFGVQESDINEFVPYKSKQEKEAEAKDSKEDEIEVSPEEIQEVEDMDEKEEKRESLDDELPPPSDADPNFADGKLGSYKSWQEKTNDIIDSRDISNIRRHKLEREKREADEDDATVGDTENAVTKEQKLDDEDFEARLAALNRIINSETIGRRVIDSPNKIVIVDALSLSQAPIAEGPLPTYPTSVSLLANSTQLGGPNRFAVEGLMDGGECQSLIDLELAGGKYGDGYYGNEKPHTQHEKFQGLTLLDAIRLYEEGALPLDAVRLFDRISTHALQITKSYLKLDKELYFDYTHLVCRTSQKKSDEKRVDLSHPVHGDNCLLDTSGACEKRKPAYTWRDYSAIVYLNDQFDGGEFIMTDATARQVTLEVKPRCGRLVSFSAGADCLHGVKPVMSGRRCAVALWFTHDPTHDERRRIREQLSNSKYFSQADAANRDEL